MGVEYVYHDYNKQVECRKSKICSTWLMTKDFTQFFIISQTECKAKAWKTEKRKPLMTDTILTVNLCKYLVSLQRFGD